MAKAIVHLQYVHWKKAFGDASNIQAQRYLVEVIDFGLASPRPMHYYFREFLKRNLEVAQPILIERLKSGSNLQRLQAARWLDKLYGKSIAAELGRGTSS